MLFVFALLYAHFAHFAVSCFKVFELGIGNNACRTFDLYASASVKLILDSTSREA